MANNTSTNTWKLNTTGVITTNPVFVKAIRWTGQTTAGHNLEILNKSGGETLFKAKCYDVNKDVHAVINNWWLGVYLNTLDSGEVYLYIA